MEAHQYAVNETDIKANIAKLDLTLIIERMIQIYKWTPFKTNLVAEQYKKYLFLKFKYGENYTLPPSIEIDELWHNHILHTEKYSQDCYTILKKFIHHCPSLKHDKNLKPIEYFNKFQNETQKLYFKEFNEYIYEYKSVLTIFIQKFQYFFKK